MPDRRPLVFASLGEVMPDVDRLLLGHEMVGRWTLGQVCNHLAKGLLLTVEGRAARGSWIKSATVGRFARWYVLRKGTMPEGIKLPSPKLAPQPDLDDRAEAESLRAAIRLFLNEPGPFPPHPMLGKLSVDQWRRFHAIHCAHHLSFARPR